MSSKAKETRYNTIPVRLGKAAAWGRAGRGASSSAPARFQSALLPPQTSAHCDCISPLPSHGEDRIGLHEVLGPSEREPTAGSGSKARGLCLQVPISGVRSKPRAPLPEEPKLELQGPHTSACRRGRQDIAPEGEEGHTESERGSTRVAAGERGQGGSGSTSCVRSDGRDIGAQRLPSASPCAPVHSVRFSGALWGENSVSAHYEGNGSCLLLDQEGGKYKASWLHLTALSSSERSSSPTSPWLIPLLPHPRGLSALLVSRTCPSFKPKLSVPVQVGSGIR